MTIFIGGSIGISKLNATIRKRLDELIQRGDAILIGDAKGADKAVQSYLAKQRDPNVTVFCMEECPDNIGESPTRHVEPQGKRDPAFLRRKTASCFRKRSAA